MNWSDTGYRNDDDINEKLYNVVIVSRNRIDFQVGFKYNECLFCTILAKPVPDLRLNIAKEPQICEYIIPNEMSSIKVNKKSEGVGQWMSRIPLQKQKVFIDSKFENLDISYCWLRNKYVLSCPNWNAVIWIVLWVARKTCWIKENRNRIKGHNRKLKKFNPNV